MNSKDTAQNSPASWAQVSPREQGQGARVCCYSRVPGERLLEDSWFKGRKSGHGVQDPASPRGSLLSLINTESNTYRLAVTDSQQIT